MSAGLDWGSTAAERAASYPCEGFVPGADLAVFRAIDISAPVDVVYRWLCRLRAAPTGEGSRLILKLIAIPPLGGLFGAAYRRVMPWFDLLMMRKQFLTLKRLAEETAMPLDPTGVS